MRVRIFGARVPCCAPRGSLLNETSAKEGDVPVATARPFPFQETTTAATRSAATVDLRPLSEFRDKPRASLPVLARIPDVTTRTRLANETGSLNKPTESKLTYRLDAAHSSVRDDSASRTGSSQRSARRGRPANSDLQELSTAIQFGVKAWGLVQSYPSALRTVGMFLVTVAAGTSMILMMGPRSGSNESAGVIQPPPTVAASEPAPAAKPATDAAEVEQDSAGATSLVPTAIGPGGLDSQPPTNLDAKPTIESSQSAGAKLLLSEPVPRLQVDRDLATQRPRKRSAPPDSYPTTSFPAPNLPGLDASQLPRAQTSDPPQAVARFRGDIEPLSR
jgi:hypothetical protein